MKRIILSLVIAWTLLGACSKKGITPTTESIVIEGATYPTVVIGNQTWTSINYDGPGGVNYNNSGTNDPIYGKLYNYNEAKAISCPSGWHLPTQGDFITMLNNLGVTPDSQNNYIVPESTARALMSKTTWNNEGNNKTGFDAVGTGFVYNGNFSDLGLMTNILTSSKTSEGADISFEIYLFGTGVISGPNIVIPNDTDRGSVRFVRDN